MSDTFTLCLNTSTIRPASLEEKIRVAGEAGYQAIELWSDDLTAHEAAGRSLSEVNGWLKDAGLTVPSIIALHGWMDTREGEEQSTAFAKARRQMEQAAAVGSPLIVASPTPDRDELDVVRVATRYRELLQMGQEIGVTPCMEFLGFFHNVHRLDQAVTIARAAEHLDARIVLDPFHLYRGGSGFSEIADLPMELVGICHFNDAPADPPQFEQGDKDRVYPGDGVLPLTEMLRQLTRGGYRGALSLELFNPVYWSQDPLQVARTGLQKMKAIVDEAAG